MAAQNYGSKADTAKSARLPIIWDKNASGDDAMKRFFLVPVNSDVRPAGNRLWAENASWTLDRDTRGVIPEAEIALEVEKRAASVL